MVVVGFTVVGFWLTFPVGFVVQLLPHTGLSSVVFVAHQNGLVVVRVVGRVVGRLVGAGCADGGQQMIGSRLLKLQTSGLCPFCIASFKAGQSVKDLHRQVSAPLLQISFKPRKKRQQLINIFKIMYGQ